MIATVKLTKHRVWARKASAPEQNEASLRRKLGQHVDITFTTADTEASNKNFLKASCKTTGSPLAVQG